jgi:hypothetical protein
MFIVPGDSQVVQPQQSFPPRNKYLQRYKAVIRSSSSTFELQILSFGTRKKSLYAHQNFSNVSRILCMFIDFYVAQGRETSEEKSTDDTRKGFNAILSQLLN